MSNVRRNVRLTCRVIEITDMVSAYGSEDRNLCLLALSGYANENWNWKGHGGVEED